MKKKTEIKLPQELHPFQLAQGADRFYSDLMYWIEGGLDMYPNKSACSTELELIRGKLAQKNVKSFMIYPNKPLDLSPDVIDIGYEFTFKKYLEHSKESFYLDRVENKENCLFLTHRVKNEIQLIVDIFGKSPSVQPETKDPVWTAFYQAEINRNMTKARMCALQFISKELSSNRHEDGVGQAISDIQDFLWKRHLQFSTSWMKFAILIGDEALKTVRESLMSESFGEDMSVMQYMEYNETHPGRYLASDEDKFRASIKKHLKKFK